MTFRRITFRKYKIVFDYWRCIATPCAGITFVLCLIIFCVAPTGRCAEWLTHYTAEWQGMLLFLCFAHFGLWCLFKRADVESLAQVERFLSSDLIEINNEWALPSFYTDLALVIVPTGAFMALTIGAPAFAAWLFFKTASSCGTPDPHPINSTIDVSPAALRRGS